MDASGSILELLCLQFSFVPSVSAVDIYSSLSSLLILTYDILLHTHVKQTKKSTSNEICMTIYFIKHMLYFNTTLLLPFHFEISIVLDQIPI